MNGKLIDLSNSKVFSFFKKKSARIEARTCLFLSPSKVSEEVVI